MQRILRSKSFRPLVALAVAIAALQFQSTELGAQSACGGFTGGCTAGACLGSDDDFCHAGGGQQCFATGCSNPMSCGLLEKYVSCGAAS
jgi:hypothetical protein